MKNLIAIPVVLALAASERAWGQSYFLFGTSPGQSESPARALSDDGRAATGYSGFGGSGYSPGFRWTQETGRVDFAGVNGNPENSVAFGISGDGQWALGTGYRQSLRRREAFRYRPDSSQFQFLGVLSGWQESTARDASFDGSVVVGASHDRGFSFGRAFRWTETGGMQALGNARPSHFSSEAYAVSADGSLTVGTASSGDTGDAVVWTADGRGTVLRNLNSTPFASSVAYGISANGEFIVGGSDLEMTIWEDGVPRGLGLFENRQTNAFGVSNDGKVVVGESSNSTALIWTEERGLESLSMYLVYQGINLPTGYIVRQARGVSADGRTIMANVINPMGTYEGIVFNVPTPSTAVLFLNVIGVLALRRVPRPSRFGMDVVG